SAVPMPCTRAKAQLGLALLLSSSGATADPPSSRHSIACRRFGMNLAPDGESSSASPPWKRPMMQIGGARFQLGAGFWGLLPMCHRGARTPLALSTQWRGQMQVDAATVKRIARLARIKITDEEAAGLEGELTQILAWVEQLGEVDTSGVEPMTRVVP